MNGGRLAIYLIGGLLVAAALWMFFFATGLDNWVPISVAIAGVLLVIGMVLMGGSDKAGHDHGHERHGGHHH